MITSASATGCLGISTNIFYYNSQQQNALGYNLSMQGIGDVAIDWPRFEEFLRSRKDFFEVSQGGGLARILLLGCTAGSIICKKKSLSSCVV